MGYWVCDVMRKVEALRGVIRKKGVEDKGLLVGGFLTTNRNESHEWGWMKPVLPPLRGGCFFWGEVPGVALAGSSLPPRYPLSPLRGGPCGALLIGDY